jgi:hypothetical protein
MKRISRGVYECANPDCDKPLNETTIKNLDPFCSTDCCHSWHGVEITVRDAKRGIFVGSSS